MITEEKAAAVANQITENLKEITDVTVTPTEYYFKYRGHTFSILYRTSPDERLGSYSFYVYPNWNDTTEQLVDLFTGLSDPDIAVSSFHSGDLGSFADLAFSKLYRVIDTRNTGVDDIFDELLNNPPLISFPLPPSSN